MLKKIAVILFVAFFASAVYAQEQETGTELIFSSEVRTGIYYERMEFFDKDDLFSMDRDHLRPLGVDDEKVQMGNRDGLSGDFQGLFALNFHLVNHDFDMGAKVRFMQNNFTRPAVMWEYAFVYKNFFDRQLRFSIGKLGESPWAADGPDINDELDAVVGIRTEFMPKFLPGLNVGFVLNSYGGYGEALNDKAIDNIPDMLKETIVGIAYDNEYFLGRLSWRFDADADSDSNQIDLQRGMEMMYRLEERIIGRYLPGFQIFANGWWKGIGPEDRIQQDAVSITTGEPFINWQNFLYIQFAPEYFTSEIRLGLNLYHKRQVFNAKLSFYYNIFPWMYAGFAAYYASETGEIKTVKDVPFLNLGIEPQIGIRLNDNAYFALVYSYDWDYINDSISKDVALKETQKINLRIVYQF